MNYDKYISNDPVHRYVRSLYQVKEPSAKEAKKQIESQKLDKVRLQVKKIANKDKTD
jgi:hypothetical protein